MTMYASVLHLNRSDVRSLRLSDEYSLHRIVFDLYPRQRTDAEIVASQSSGILYADMGGDTNGWRILMLSDRKPATSVSGGQGHVESKPLPDSFLEDDMYRFRVNVNPTYRDSKTKKLIPIRGRDAIKNWFIKRSTQSWGFECLPQKLQISNVEIKRFRDKSRGTVTIAQAQVSGILRVQNREQFKHSFKTGIGRARSWGCGLLQIVPVQSP